jgi:uncharacterized membrane protein
MKKISEINIRFAFKVSLILKGIYSLIEIILGTLVFFLSKAFLISTLSFFFQGELIEDSKDFFANYLMTAAHNISINGKYFLAFYLISHGIIKLLLVAGLLKEKLWAYPSSIIVFSLFIFYQLYRYFHTFSIGLLLLTILDIIIILLTIHEYRYIKSHINVVLNC